MSHAKPTEPELVSLRTSAEPDQTGGQKSLHSEQPAKVQSSIKGLKWPRAIANYDSGLNEVQPMRMLLTLQNTSTTKILHAATATPPPPPPPLGIQTAPLHRLNSL